MLFRKYSKIGSRPKFTRPPIQESGSSENNRRVLRHAQQPCASKCTAALRIPGSLSEVEGFAYCKRVVTKKITAGVLRHAQQPCVSKCSAALRVQMHSSPARPKIPERQSKGSPIQELPKQFLGRKSGQVPASKEQGFRPL